MQRSFEAGLVGEIALNDFGAGFGQPVCLLRFPREDTHLLALPEQAPGDGSSLLSGGSCHEYGLSFGHNCLLVWHAPETIANLIVGPTACSRRTTGAGLF
jgi:hypothetical protein